MKNRKRIGVLIVSLLMLFSLLIAGCTGSQNAFTDQTKRDKPVIAVTIVPEETFVQAVCGDLAEVVVMVPPGYSPANYEPSPQEMEQFSRANIYFAIGVPAEEATILPKAS